jgi:hypothetical protein
MMAFAQSHRVFHEGRVNLALEVVTGPLLQIALGPVSMPLPKMVEVVMREGQPSDLALDRNNAQFGMALQNSGQDQDSDRLAHRELAHQQVGQKAG